MDAWPVYMFTWRIFPKIVVYLFYTYSGLHLTCFQGQISWVIEKHISAHAMEFTQYARWSRKNRKNLRCPTGVHRDSISHKFAFAWSRIPKKCSFYTFFAGNSIAFCTLVIYSLWSVCPLFAYGLTHMFTRHRFVRRFAVVSVWKE